MAMQSLERTLDILEYLGGKNESVGLSELAGATALPASTVHRILQCLAKRSYVSYNSQTHLYHLGPAWIQIGQTSMRMINLSEVCHPFLTELMQATGEDAFLVVRSGYRGVVLQRVEGPNPLKIVELNGMEMDLHCGGIRRSLLAFLTEAFIEEYIQRGLPTYTDKTIGDPDALRANLAQIRQEGVATSFGEYISEAVGTGAPVMDAMNHPVGSIGVVMPAYRANEEAQRFVRKQVKLYSRKISKALGN